MTGSGKTEVYLRVIAAALARGRRALVLVPEISLTPQLAARFRGRFGDRVAVLHCGLSDAARADAWRRIARGQVDIALGARSAVFAPLANLGVVVVDEEHDGSFKQEEGVRYHGRDVALVRARARRRGGVLGSATPSLETYVAAQRGAARPARAARARDARGRCRASRSSTCKHARAARRCSRRRCSQALDETLAAGEQAILFLNRRGFSTFSLCKACGQAVRCRHCSVSLTYHRGDDRLLCHYCGFSTRAAEDVPGVRQAGDRAHGLGTEQLEQLLARVAAGRARRAARSRHRRRRRACMTLLDAFRAREIDILVGTQMVTKGHDFPGVTLVGVVLRRPGAQPARLPRLGAHLPAARAGGGARRPRRQAGARDPADVPAARRRRRLRARPRLRALRRRRAARAASSRAIRRTRAWPACASTAPIRCWCATRRCARPRRRARWPSRRRPRRRRRCSGPRRRRCRA